MHAATKVDVVVLQEYHVKEPDAMVHAAANLHGLLLQHAHAWSGLARIEYTRLCTSIDECLLIFVRHRGYARHTLQDVQHQALRLQEALLPTLHAHHDVAGLYVRPVFDIYFHLQLRVETVEHLFGYLHAGKDAFFLYQQLALPHLVGRDAAQGGMVTVTNVLGKCKVYQAVVQFLLR